MTKIKLMVEEKYPTGIIVEDKYLERYVVTLSPDELELYDYGDIIYGYIEG